MNLTLMTKASPQILLLTDTEKLGYNFWCVCVCVCVGMFLVRHIYSGICLNAEPNSQSFPLCVGLGTYYLLV